MRKKSGNLCTKTSKVLLHVCFFRIFQKSEITCLLRKYTPSLIPMSKMFRIGVLSVVMCLGVSTGSLKADFEADLLKVLSIDDRGFPKEVLSDPAYWGELWDLYKAYEGLYGEFCEDVRDVVKNSNLTVNGISPEEDPDVFAERAFCLLNLSRDLYAKVSEYASATYDFGEDNGFESVEPLLLSECRYVFVRRILGLSRFIVRHYANELGLSAFVDTKDRTPDEKILAEILKPFAKKDACEELEAKDNNSQLIQSLHILSNVFDEFFANNDKTLKEVKKAFGDRLSSWFGVQKMYYKYVLEHSETLSSALSDLCQSVWGRVERMLSVNEKLSPEQRKQALPFFKKEKEKDIGVLLEAKEIFRKHEKEIRLKEQQASKEATLKRKKLKDEIAGEKEALEAKKDELSKLQGSGTEISDEKKELEEEVKQLQETIEALKGQITKLPYPSTKAKYKMQRKAAKKGITKDERDAAVFANYVQLPGKCGAFQNAFLYYQAIMWNVFTDGIDVMKGYGRKIYDKLEIKEPELTDDFEEEYSALVKDM